MDLVSNFTVRGQDLYLWVLDWCKKQLVVEGEEVHVVREVQQFFCLFIVWTLHTVRLHDNSLNIGHTTHPVRAIAICVILAAVLDSIMQDGRCECVRLVAQQTAAVEARVVLIVALDMWVWRGRKVVQGQRRLLLLCVVADLYSAVLPCGVESERRCVGLGRALSSHAGGSISI